MHRPGFPLRITETPGVRLLELESAVPAPYYVSG